MLRRGAGRLLPSLLRGGSAAASSSAECAAAAAAATSPSYAAFSRSELDERRDPRSRWRGTDAPSPSPPNPLSLSRLSSSPPASPPLPLNAPRLCELRGGHRGAERPVPLRPPVREPYQPHLVRFCLGLRGGGGANPLCSLSRARSLAPATPSGLIAPVRTRLHGRANRDGRALRARCRSA
jgi:hypothetical protein